MSKLDSGTWKHYIRCIGNPGQSIISPIIGRSDSARRRTHRASLVVDEANFAQTAQGTSSEIDNGYKFPAAAVIHREAISGRTDHLGVFNEQCRMTATICCALQIKRDGSAALSRVTANDFVLLIS